MTNLGQFHVDEVSPSYWRVTFANGPVNLLDPDTIATKPAELRTDLPGGGERLYAGATGIGHVFVAGREIVTGEEMTDARPGVVLRSGRDTR